MQGEGIVVFKGGGRVMDTGHWELDEAGPDAHIPVRTYESFWSIVLAGGAFLTVLGCGLL